MDIQQIELIFYYQPNRMNAFNVLIGALETVPDLDRLVIRFPKSKERFFHYLDNAVRHHKKIITGWSFFSAEFLDIQKLLHLVKDKYATHLGNVYRHIALLK